eukprot:s1486_g16.t1
MTALHNWLVTSVENEVVTLTQDSQSCVVSLPPGSSLDFCQAAEVCAGIGGTLAGAVAVGLRPLVALDQSPFSCSLLRSNAVPVVLQGDLQCLTTLARFHLAHLTSRFGLLAGFPCQPFCNLGHSLAFHDRRSRTFQFILDLAWLTQAAFVLLECVTGAGSHPQVKAELAEFCAVRGFRMTCTILHLDRAFPCRRTRWWCLMYPAWLPQIDIPDLPQSSAHRVLRDIFPFWPIWPEEEELELKLDDQELEMYDSLDYGFTLADRLLNMNGQCPTLLHSMGNVLRSCPCLCRGPISESLLRAQGLHGVVVKSAYESVEFRHLHPNEAAYLLGVPAQLLQSANLRGLLSQLGQVASPVQSHWMLCHFWSLLGLTDRAALPRLHAEFMNLHMAGHLRLWTPPLDFWPRRIEVHVPEGVPLQVCLSAPTTCSGLLMAEAALGRKVEQLSLQDSWGPLDHHDWIIDSTLTLSSWHGLGFSLDPSLRCLGLDDATMTREGKSMIVAAGLPPSCFLSPRNLASLLDLWPACARLLLSTHVPRDQELHGFFLADRHWIYFRCSALARVLHVAVYDGLRCSLSSDLVHLDLLLHQNRVGFGSADEASVLEWLANFLPSKGVPAEKALPRAKLALQKLGLSTLREALLQKDPWRALKQAGNITGRPFQWVTFEELQHHIAARAEAGPSNSKPKKQPRSRQPRHDPVVALSPDTVVLYPSTFVDTHDDAVSPISFPEVESNARGVCVVTAEQALAFQKSSTNLSTDALAIVSIGEVPSVPAITQLDLQWPALYLPTKEPILVKGSLLQLGDIAVSLAKTQDAPAVTTLDTEVVRVAVFKDVFAKDWQQLVRGPVKLLLSLLTPLKPCPDAGCDGSCKYFHAACDEEVTNPVLDVWSWRWTNLDNKTLPVDQATVFSVFIRLPRSALKSLLSVSGWHGIFLEPRPATKQGPHPAYAVIWLPKTYDLSAALDLKRRHDNVIGIARMQQKLGLRVLKKHEAATMELVHPGQPLALCSVDRIYELSPLPHGLSQAQVVSLLQAWHWVAKPLRPARSTECGQYWDIGTPDDPPAAILHTTQGSVTVTCKKEKDRQQQPRANIQASARTKKHMQAKPAMSTSSTGVDPWLVVDPWKNWSPSTEVSGQEVVFTDGRGSGSQPAKQKLEVLEQRLMQHVDQRLAAHPPPGLTAMETDAEEYRDTEIHELKAQNAKFETWFSDIGVRFGNMDSQLATQSAQMAQLQSSLEAQKATTSGLQNALDGLNQSFRLELHNTMEAQTTRLEALLEKRARSS